MRDEWNESTEGQGNVKSNARIPDPTNELSLADQYLLALAEGPVILAVPGDRLRGFTSLAAAMAYLEADRARRGQGPAKKVLLVGGLTNGGSNDVGSI